jgi:hypothetical protein
MRRSASWSAACAAGHPVLRRRVGWVHKGMPCYFHLQFAEAESRRRANFSSPRGLAVRSIAAKGRYAPCSWTPEESRVEGCEHQDDANIRCQPFPESVSEEHEIYTDYDGCHRHQVKHDSYVSAHVSLWFTHKRRSSRFTTLTRRVAWFGKCMRLWFQQEDLSVLLSALLCGPVERALHVDKR